MPWWRKLLALLGLTDDARVHVRATGIDVVITGDPKLVRTVLEVVKAELERRPRKKKRLADPANSGPPDTDSQVVLPSDLDEMDSPYAIPEHRPARAKAEIIDKSRGKPKDRTRITSDSDIVEVVDEKTMDDVSLRSTIEETADNHGPKPKVMPPEQPERITQPDSISDAESFDAGESDQGTDPDLDFESRPT